MLTYAKPKTEVVNCRIGSLEIFNNLTGFAARVNCRIGSLEIANECMHNGIPVNCRIGSLEN